MPKAAKVFLVEDDKNYRGAVRMFLELVGHTIVFEADSLEDALKKIPELTKKGVRVAILDGNLSPHDTSGNDGRRIAVEMRRQTPGIKIIVNSDREYDFGDVWTGKEIEKLAQVVTEI